LMWVVSWTMMASSWMSVLDLIDSKIINKNTILLIFFTILHPRKQIDEQV